MMATMASSTVLFFFFSALFMPLSITSSYQNLYEHHFCNPYPETASNYTSDSTFSTNLKQLIVEIPEKAATFNPNGFFNLTYGEGPDAINSLFQCRGDVFSTPQLCRDCIRLVLKELINYCPNEKEVMLWYDMCTLRYANRPIMGIMKERPGFRTGSDYNIPVDTDKFNATLWSLMEGLITEAVSGSGYSGRSIKLFDSEDTTLYGLVQCTSDISPSNCSSCLSNAVKFLFNYTTGQSPNGTGVYLPSCIARYETYPFYYESLPPAAAPAPPSATNSSSSPPPPQSSAAAAQAPPPETSTNSSGNLVSIIVGTSASAAFLVILLLGFYICRRKRANKENKENNQEIQLLGIREGRLADGFSNIDYLQGETQMESQELPLIQLDLIYAATKHFSDENKLGEGGFGPVYKGTLEDGKEIAVKRLSKTSGQGLKEFKNEVILIARLQHRNLVRLLGCCLEGQELLLIYEYMPNKSLDVFLFDSTRGAQLDWKTRLNIINGIARGLLYLHEDSRLRIIHRDLKASNVLLDREMNPKISDFGMARIFGGNQNEANTVRIVGTYGYMAPEYAMEGLFSIKSDVFSFGVLLLEIISGKKNSGFHLLQLGHSLLTFAWKLWNEGQGMELMDPLLVHSCVEIEVLKCIHIGLLCVQEDPADRPTMSHVVGMFVTDGITLSQPKQPAFSIGRVDVKSTNKSIQSKEVCSNIKELVDERSTESMQNKEGCSSSELLKKTSARQIAKSASPYEHLRQALQQGCEVSVKDLDSLLSLLSEKKRKMEQEEAESNMKILLDFMHCLRKQKLEELDEIQTDLQYIKEDINAVERRRIELHRARERYLIKLRMLGDNPNATKACPSLMDKHSNVITSSAHSVQGWMGSGDPQNKKADVKAQASSQGLQIKDAYSGSDSQQITQSGPSVARKRRVHAQFNDLQECYLQKRRHWARQSHKQEERDTNVLTREGYHAGLDDFQSVLTTFTRYSRLRAIAELKHVDLFHSANIVSSIEFDRDDELFATAGVSRSIKVFEFSSVVNEPADVHCPIVEMSTLSKLSCLSWNKYMKNHIASSDYEGIVTVWDVTTRQSVMEYEEHEKRAWSVDFSRTDPSMLVSGSDDCKVKVWCTKQEASVINIDMKANICSVKYNPGSSIYVAVGSADHHIHYYDLRNISQPLHVFGGHRKAVSYVKFMSNNELASASTDSTLRLWDVKENLPLRTFRGHTNEKNFVGLTVNSEFIACGSETNEVFVYHKAISKPAAWHRFSPLNTDDSDEDAGSYFISAVCWKSDSPTMLTANSQGTIKVLVLAA